MKIILILLTIPFLALARYDETLPKGVRLLAVRQVQSDRVDSFQNISGTKENYSVDFKLDSQSLSEIDLVNEYILKDLKSNSVEAYDKLVAANYRFDVKAKVNVTGFGFGYGITNRTTFYGVIPYYRANINVTPVRTQGNNYNEVNEILKNSSNNNGVVLDMNSLPDADEGLIQSAVQNFYGYEALGEWQASGLGDIELGVKHRYKVWRDGGALVSTGLSIPTGRLDNPDIIQDIGFGSGHWGVFIESGLGQSYKKNDFNFSARAHFSLPTEKELRPSSSNSDLTVEKNNYKINPGPKFTISPSYSYHINSWWQIHSGIDYEIKLEDNYISQVEYYDQKLESISSWESTTLNVGIDFTTVKAYMNKEFQAPGSIGVNYKKVLAGRNIPNTTLFSAELRLFF
ncbi:MAG: hypothetical protein BM556_15885 [Bacteriovorax sp. MedPE-SWde]|nr:MAG: hypothetical protein BM556_15885 [Bacteriovorax sp. MedPE-SWde]